MTRFYMSWPEVVTGVSASVSGSWTSGTMVFYNRRLRTDPVGASAPWGITANKVVATNPTNAGLISFVSDPFPAAGTCPAGTAVKLVLPAHEVSAAHDAMLRMTVHILSNDGNTDRGLLYAGPPETTVAASGEVNNREFAVTTATTRRLNAVTATTVNWQIGDRLEVELGVRFVQATTAGQGILWFTANADTTDYDEYVEQPLTPTRRPWLEIATDFFTLSGLQTEEFRYTASGYVLNRNVSTLPFVDFDVIEGLDNAPVSMSSVNREGMDGGLVDSEFEAPRTVTLGGTIYTSPTALETELNKLKANYAPSALDKPLYYMSDDGVLRHVMGKSQGLRYNKDRSRGMGVIKFQVQIVCQDPRIYSGTDYIQTFNNSTFTVAGNRDTPHKMVLKCISNSGSAVTLAHTNLMGEFIYTLPAMTAGQTIVIDVNTRSIILNGTTSLRATSTVAPSWSNIHPGTNSFICNMSPGVVDVTVQYKPAWR